MNSPTDSGARRVAVSEWRMHWRVALAATLGAGVSFSIWPAVSSLFVEPLQATFGWSRGEIALAQNASLAAALFSPVLGRLVDRIGVRPVLLVGLCLTAMGYFCLALLHGPLPVYYLIYTLFAIVGVTTTGLTFTRVISGAFDASRGLALAVTRSGLALSSAILPPVVFMVIAAFGWRAGYALMGILILAVAFPVTWLWIRNGAVQSVSAAAGRAPIAWSSLLKNHRVVLICLAAALNYAPIVALLSQFQPMLTGKGVDPADAAGIIGLIGAAALIGALISGVLVDRVWAPAVAFIFTLGPALGCLMLMSDSLDRTTAIIAVVLLGLGQGAEIDVVAYMIARYFGLKAYASIYGLSVLVISLMVAIGGTLIGLSFDRFGHYNVALAVASGCFVISALSYLGMGRYPAPLQSAAFDVGPSSAAVRQ